MVTAVGVNRTPGYFCTLEITTKIGVHMDDLMTVAEVAEALRVTKNSVWRWQREGRLPEPLDIRPEGSKRPLLRYRRSQLATWLGATSE